MLTCKSCGHNVPDGSRFCTRCGASLAEATAPVFTPDPVPATIPESAPMFTPEPAPAAPVEPAPVFIPEPAPVFAAEPAPVFSPESTPVVPVAPATSTQGMNFDFSTNTATPASPKRYEYKILSQKDKWFSGKFDPMMLEEAINAYAQQGWRVIGCATADIPGFSASRQEFITLLEREV
ncbi:MAG: DUF4177 domain-containing protein [Oscillospiraceae bacterium]|nr:DUF4177 domain-containing protein [Oscillospiraceae bacterium]